jgi:carbon storage regulator
MLVLRRKVEEAIVLDGSIRVVVLAVEGERVKLGIEAPDRVAIVREELLLRKVQEEQKTAP